MTGEIIKNLEPRLNLKSPALADIMSAMHGLETPLRNSGLDTRLRELIKVRASQLNGCAYCLDMHTKDARSHGESEQRLYALNAWRETPFFTDRERAALEWTEHLTLLAQKGISDELYERIRQHFSEDEIMHLALAVVQAIGWNRLVMTARPPAGSYQPAQSERASA
jgi:AhpD family alkylhydroperoxidase